MNKYHEQLAKESIPKLLWKQSMPAMIGLVVLSLYNLVDTIFVGRYVGSMGIAGLAIAFPIQMIVMALSQMLGIGAASIISRNIGAKKYHVAEKVMGNFFSLTILFSIILTILGLIFLKPLLILFGATEAILPYAAEYMGITFMGTIFIMFAAGSNNLIRAEGNAKFAMKLLLISAIANVILDPIFISVLNMGMKGAAIATVIAHIVAAAGAFYFFAKGKSGVEFHIKNLLLDLKTIKEMFAIGLSTFSRMVAGSAMAIIMNHSLAFYGGDIAIAALGIINRFFGVMMMPLFGLINGMQPIVGYNYGAKDFKRTKETLILSIKVASIVSIVIFAGIMLFTEEIISVFTTETDLISLSTDAAKIMILMLPVVGFQIVGSGMYQSIGRAGKAFLLSIMRQVIFLIPLLLVLPLFFGLKGIFIAFPIADLLSGAVTFFIMKKDLKTLHLNF